MDDQAGVRLQESVVEVRRLLEKHRMLETVARRQETPRSALLEQMQHRQNLAELQRRLRALHPADIAHILESLPIGDRLTVWQGLAPAQAGPALVEVTREVRESLVENTDRGNLLALLRELDADDLRYLSESLPEDLVDEVSALLDAHDRSWMEQSRAYPESSAARLMMQDVLSLHESQTAGDAIAIIRRRGRLPSHTDRLFVVDSRNVLVGAVGLGALLIAAPDAPVTTVMEADIRRFHPYDDAEEVAKAFERYDLLSAPIVDDRGKLVGRVTADAVMDFIRASSANEVLALAGLRKAEDLLAPVWDSARNRWPWLAVNLGTAFIASRVIGAFEGTIQQLVALAALMPIVASIGGNTGNQTVALVVRGLALD
jgi:magnesium transporter